MITSFRNMYAEQPGSSEIPAQAGIQLATLDSRLRGNDGTSKSRIEKAPGSEFCSRGQQKRRPVAMNASKRWASVPGDQLCRRSLSRLASCDGADWAVCGIFAVQKICSGKPVDDCQRLNSRECFFRSAVYQIPITTRGDGVFGGNLNPARRHGCSRSGSQKCEPWKFRFPMVPISGLFAGTQAG
jgi:hypothetical protein